MALWRWFSQVWAVTLLNLRTVGQRRGSSAATVFGVAGVVMVFSILPASVSMMTMAFS